MIGILDYGCGNLRSLENALEALGLESRRVARAAELKGVNRLILPGVGHFGHAMTQLRERNLDSAVTTFATSGRPLLGICLGMQLLFEGSEEAPGIDGLALLPGRFGRFSSDAKAPAKKHSRRWQRLKEDAESSRTTRIFSLRSPFPHSPLRLFFSRRLPQRQTVAAPLKVPHMGWSTVDLGDRAGTAYFVHSYFLPQWQAAPPQMLGLSDYGRPFVSAFRSGNLAGCQFHPEKSGAWGLELLKEMLAW